MLKCLIINNFALIKDVEIVFDDKLNVISGETGSGKSLLMKALKFVLGDRGDKSFIRINEKFTKVQCVFENLNDRVLNECNELGIDIEKDEDLIISRSLTTDGKNDIRINGNICTLTNLNKITKLIVDFYGQQEHYSLLDITNQLNIVDGFRGEIINGLKEQLNGLIQNKKAIELALTQNYGNERDKLLKIELLEFEINELVNNEFNDEYEESLKNKKIKIQASQKIKQSIDNIYHILNCGNNNSAISNNFKEIGYELKNIEKYDDTVTDLIEVSENIRYEVEDFENKIIKLEDSIIDDNYNIDEIEEELEKIKNLKRKYGNSNTDRNEYLTNAKKELDIILNNEKFINECNNKLKDLDVKIISVCKNLYIEREVSINEIEKSITENLKHLEMKNAKFEIKHIYNEDFNKLTLNGLDTLEFIFTSNLGQPLKPLNKIISGGELSRFMLAYKNVIMLKDNINLLILDEIDSGISGIVGQKVANKICDISRICQVISISHLPQIVSMADNNLLVFKENDQNETQTKVNYIKGDDLLKEIARLSGSKEIKELDLQYANELKQYSSKYKKEIK